MADLTIPATFPAGEIVALNVSAEAYMEKYAADHYEWAQGAVIKMSPVTQRHQKTVFYLTALIDVYLEHNPIGLTIGKPFVMRLENAILEPDLQVILKRNPGDLTNTAMIGPADICIEVATIESTPRDYGYAFKAYEDAGVREYWLIDPVRATHTFYRVGDYRLYKRFDVDKDGFYESPVLPGFKLHVPTLWQDELPGIVEIVDSVKAMHTD